MINKLCPDDGCLITYSSTYRSASGLLLEIYRCGRCGKIWEVPPKIEGYEYASKGKDPHPKKSCDSND